MNELQRCLAVFKHSPFKVRLMLIDMLCDLFSEKPQQKKKPPLMRHRGMPHFPLVPIFPLFTETVISLAKQFVMNS